MNKNLKRALNTTAAVSMSLAMVLGAVAPVTNVSATPVADVAHDAYAQGCYDILAAILDDFGGLDAVKNLSYDAEKVKFDAAGEYFSATEANLNKTDGLTILGIKENTATVAANTTVASIAKTVSTYSFDEADIDTEVVDFANHLLGVKDYSSVEDAAKRVYALYIADSAQDANFKYWADDENDIDNDEEYAKAKAAYDKVDKVAAYAGNVATTNKNEMANFDEDMEIVKEKLDNYVSDNNEVYYKDYVEALEDLPVYAGGPSVYGLVERNADIPLNKLAALEKAIKNIKADKAELSDEIKFEDVADEEEVAYYIEGLETIVEEMKEAKDLMKTTSDTYKAFKAVKSKLLALAGSTVDNYEAKLAEFRAQDVEAVVNYVDEVFSKFFYVKATYRTSNGEYSLTLKDADYGRYVSTEDFNTSELNALKTILTKNIDEESEESLYDMLDEKSVDIEKLYKAVTEDIEGLTLSSVITDKEAAKIIAAHKAMIRLNHKDGDLYSSLSPEEKREVKANEELVDVLYKKLLYTGEVVMTGWVEDAKGWKYYTEDGVRVTEGWAAGNGYWSYMKNGYSVSNEWCAAKDGWYYMGADGKMVTGVVTIDGVEYNFGTDGIWVR